MRPFFVSESVIHSLLDFHLQNSLYNPHKLKQVDRQNRLYNESCGLFDPIRIISVVFIERSYLFSLVLAFYSLANEIGCFKVLFHTMFVNVYHHLLWC